MWYVMFLVMTVSGPAVIASERGYDTKLVCETHKIPMTIYLRQKGAKIMAPPKCVELKGPLV
jgi:hypothetical protein